MKGQSIIELLIVIGIFVIVAGSMTFFVLDSYAAGRLAREMTVANFLTEEGMEAVRSIRDNSWSNLTSGSHGLILSGNHWVFQGTEENLGAKLRKGIRKLIIEDVDSNRKKITSIVSWQFIENRPEELKLVSYLTNWQKSNLIEERRPTNYTDFVGRTNNPRRAYDYPDGTTFARTRYNITADPSITFYDWQTTSIVYSFLALKYRYHANAATNDTYAIAYSTNGCNGVFKDLIPPTSASSPDTTISADLSPSQDLSQLCLKIYTRRVGSADNKDVFTRDIWTEGTY
jgi:hypothetical protein